MEKFNKLSRAEMKNVLGGDELRPFDPLCDEYNNDSTWIGGCPCIADSDCQVRRYMSGPLVGTPIPGSGYCVNGGCS